MGLLLRAFHPFAAPAQKHIKDSNKLIISVLYHFDISKVIDVPTPRQLILLVFHPFVASLAENSFCPFVVKIKVRRSPYTRITAVIQIVRRPRHFEPNAVMIKFSRQKNGGGSIGATHQDVNKNSPYRRQSIRGTPVYPCCTGLKGAIPQDTHICFPSP